MKKKIVSLLLALVTLLSVLALPLSAAGSVTTELRDFSKSTVDEDLIGSTYKATALSVGKKIESKSDIVATFPKADGGAPSIIEVMEVGYDKSKGSSSQISLYLWIYVPDPDFQPTSALNKVTLATAFDFNPLEKGVEAAENWVAESYEQFSLRHVSSSESGTVYKFIVEGFDASVCINGGTRRYNISRYDLHYKGETNAENYTEGRSYICTGTHADKSYTAVANGLDVLEIDELYQTCFRYDNLQDDGLVDRKTQINTVYFSIPASYEFIYNDLFSIKTDWLRYRSAPMIVTTDQDFFNGLKDWIMDPLSTNVNTEKPDYSFWLYSRDFYSGGSLGVPLSSYFYDYSYNGSDGFSSLEYAVSANSDAKEINPLFWFFGFKGSDAAWGNDDIADAYVPASSVLQYYSNYMAAGKSTDYQHLITNGLVARAPLADGYGKQSLTILASDRMDSHLVGYEYSSWWEKFIDFFINEQAEESIEGVNAIQKVKGGDFSVMAKMSAEDVCKKYLIASEDVESFMTFCKDEVNAGNTVVVLHYASSVYEAYPILVRTPTGIEGATAYGAIQDIFFDFTVIEMTFGSAYDRTVIPVSAENQTVVGTISPPGGPGDGDDDSGWEDFLKKLNEFLDRFAQILMWIVGFSVLALIIWLVSLLMKPINAVGGYLSDKAEDARRRREEKREREERNKRWRK